MIRYLTNLQFASPWAFALLALPALMVAWQIWRRRRLYPALRFSSLEGLGRHLRPWRGRLRSLLYVLRALALAALVIALARPQLPLQEEEVSTEGIDIVLSIDVSGSMEALDFQPNRLGAAKEKAKAFIDQRVNDRIGLVVFSGESFTQCPITSDHTLVKQLVDELTSGLLESGTAIGMGLASAVNRLRSSEARSRVVVLLTDGDNNAGSIDPLSAAEAAARYGIRVYTIGVGRNGLAPFRTQNIFGDYVMREEEVRLDEALLKQIAERTQGKYFHATNNQALERVYAEIDQLEKTRVEVSRIVRKTEEFRAFLIAGALLLLLEFLLRYGLTRSIP
jgi:Ca-activated chloride channel family protein